MIRRVSFIRRKAGLTREQFLAHWRGAHADIVRQLPGLRGLRFTPIAKCAPAELAWDGLGETWFDTIAESDRAFGAEPFKTLLAEDRAAFIGDSQSCYVKEPPDAAPQPLESVR
jgi:uncharacterized protein (TIGR02118 family)